jgi:hypothetical protein
MYAKRRLYVFSLWMLGLYFSAAAHYRLWDLLDRKADFPGYCFFEKSSERRECLERACAPKGGGSIVSGGDNHS